MSSKIKDLVEVVANGSRTAAHRGSAPGELSTFLLSYEVGDALARTVERVVSEGPEPKNCLVVGGPGCGGRRLSHRPERVA